MPRRMLIALGLLATGLTGCGDDRTGPDVDPVAGHYTASVISNTTRDTTVDLIARGLTFDLALEPDGKLAGHFEFTTGTNQPGVTFDIAGTWVRTDSGLVVKDNADSFVSHVLFAVHDDRLEGLGQVGESTLRMVLDRQAP